jgi:hypothetical protein
MDNSGHRWGFSQHSHNSRSHRINRRIDHAHYDRFSRTLHEYIAIYSFYRLCHILSTHICITMSVCT